MKEITGDMWAFWGLYPIAITTATMVSKKGNCPMPRGCAGQAKIKFPDLPHKLGQLILEKVPRVLEPIPGLISFPVEKSPLVFPEMNIIRTSAQQLSEFADEKHWSRVIVPRPGCGSGGMKWRDVKPVLARYFDDRFLIIDIGETTVFP